MMGDCFKNHAGRRGAGELAKGDSMSVLVLFVGTWALAIAIEVGLPSVIAFMLRVTGQDD